MRTLIDIFGKGNMDLFHTNMISWLISPDAEHGLKSSFLEKFSETLAKRGNIKLKQEVEHGEIVVHSKTIYYKWYYVIEIHTLNSLFVIHNKTMGIGVHSLSTCFKKVKSYINNNADIIRLGFCDATFSTVVNDNYPLITYDDILEILETIKLDTNNDFSVLVRHYRNFLKRELQILEWISEYYSRNSLPKKDNIVNTVTSVGDYIEKYKRFLNLYYLAKLKEKIRSVEVYKESDWQIWNVRKMDVCLDYYVDFQKKYILNNRLQDLCKSMDASLYFHIEIQEGVLSKSAKDLSGTLQLRCYSIEQSNKAIHTKLRQIIFQKEDEFNYSTHVKENAESFYVLSYCLRKEDLLFPNMIKKLTKFIERFGTFVTT